MGIKVIDSSDYLRPFTVPSGYSDLYLIVALHRSFSGTSFQYASSVTVSGEPLFLLGRDNVYLPSINSTRTLEFWGIRNPSPGYSKSISVSPSGYDVRWCLVRGCDGSDPVLQFSKFSLSALSTEIDITVAQDGDFVFGTSGNADVNVSFSLLHVTPWIFYGIVDVRDGYTHPRISATLSSSPPGQAFFGFARLRPATDESPYVSATLPINFSSGQLNVLVSSYDASAGDVLLVVISVPAAYTVSTPASWRLLKLASTSQFNMYAFVKAASGGSEMHSFPTTAPSISHIAVNPVVIKRASIDRIRVQSTTYGPLSNYPRLEFGAPERAQSNALMLVAMTHTASGSPVPFPGGSYRVYESHAGSFSQALVTRRSVYPFSPGDYGRAFFSASTTITHQFSFGIEIDSSEKLFDQWIVLGKSIGTSSQEDAQALRVRETSIDRLERTIYSLANGVMSDFDVSPSGRAVIIPRSSGYPVIRSWRNELGRPFSSPSHAYLSSGVIVGRFSPSEKAIVFGRNVSPYFFAWRWEWGLPVGGVYALPSPAPSTSYARDVAFHPSGQHVALSGGQPDALSVYAWSDASGFGTRIFVSSIGTNVIAHSLAWSPDGAWLVAGCVNPVDQVRFLRVYSFSGSSLTFVADHSMPQYVGSLCVRFSPDGQYLLVTGFATDGAKIYSWTGTGLGSEVVSSVPDPVRAFSPGEWSRRGDFVAFIGGSPPGGEVYVYPFSGGVLGAKLARAVPAGYGSSEGGDTLGGVAWFPSEILSASSIAAMRLEARGFVSSAGQISIESRNPGASSVAVLQIELARETDGLGEISIESYLSMSLSDLGRAIERDPAFNSVLRRFP